MKKTLLVFLIFPIILYSQTKYRFNINAINLPQDNKGVLAYVNISDPNPNISGSGGKFDNTVFLFSSGFLLSGYSMDTLWANGVAKSSLVNDYLPGIVNNVADDPKNIIYVIKKDDPPFGKSWQDWSNAVSLGADFYDGNNDGIYNPVDLNGNSIWNETEDKPSLIGDEMTWCVYSDKLPSTERKYKSVKPLGIEIQQTICGYASIEKFLAHTLFIRYRLINTGTVAAKLDSVFFAIYADADLGDASDDLNGCDSLLNSSYIYNNGTDSEYGSQPPSFFMKYLQGPISYIAGETFIDINSNGIFDNGIDTPLDTAYNRKGNLFSKQDYLGAKNLEISANIVTRGSDPYLRDPSNQTEVYNYLNGLNRTGTTVNPCNFYGTVNGGINCSEINPYLWFSGKPENNVGWINNSPGDLRSIISSGRFSLEKNKPIDIWIAYIIGSGNNALDAISVTRNYARSVQDYFDNNFSKTVTNLEDDISLIKDFSISQNYPNPFNPSTIITYQIPQASNVNLKVFDILGNEIATLVNEDKPAGFYSVEFRMQNLELSSGIYFYRLVVYPDKIGAGSFIETKKMILLK